MAWRGGRGWPGDLAIALLLAALAAVGTAAAPTRLYSFDAVSYAHQVEQFAATGERAWLFHPHHLLFNSLSFLWWRLGRVSGSARPLEAQQMLNAFAGGAGVALCYAAARQATGSRVLAVAMALIVASSWGFWLIAADGDIYALGFALLIASIWLALRLLDRPSAALAAGLGATAGVATLVHQMHALLLPALVAAPLLAPTEGGDGGPQSGRRLPRRVRLLVVTLAVYGSLVAIPYWLAAASLGHASPAALLRWATSYARDGRWWDFDLRKNAGLDLSALAREFRAGDTGGWHAPQWEWDWGDATLTVLVTALALLLIWRARGVRGRQLLIGGIWLATYAGFFTVWVPGYLPFWLPPAVGLLLLGAVVLEGSIGTAPARWAAGRAGAGLRAAAGGLAALAAWYLLAANRPAVRHGQEAGANPYLQFAAQVQASTHGGDAAAGRPSDLIVSTGTGDYAALEVYLPYFARRDVATLGDLLKHHGPGAGRTRGEALDWLQAAIEARWARGAAVYALQDMVAGRASFESLGQRFGMTLEESRAFIARFRTRPAFRARGTQALELLPAGGTANPAPERP